MYLATQRFGSQDPLSAACALPAACAKPVFSLELSAKPTILASWRPRRPADGPPGAQDGLPTGLLAPKTASRRASWRARRPPDGPPGAQDGLPTGLLTPQTASDGPSPADKITCRQVHLPHKSALAPSEPSTPVLFCRSRRTAVTACLTRQPPDELSCMSTLLHVNLLPSNYATGSHFFCIVYSTRVFEKGPYMEYVSIQII